MIYLLNPIERRKLYHLVTILVSNTNIPIERIIDFLVDHVLRLSNAPIPILYTPLIARIEAVLTILRGLVAQRDADIGQVTVNVSEFDAKMAGLTAFLNDMEAKCRVAYPDNEILMKYWYFTDRKVFRTGPEQAIIDLFDNWLIRLATKPLIADELLEATAWVSDLKLKRSAKGTEKITVFEDRKDVRIAHENAFAATRKNFGDLFSMHTEDLRNLLDCFNANLLDLDETDPNRLMVNQFAIFITNGELGYNLSAPFAFGDSFYTENPTEFDAIIFLSIDIATSIPEFAVTIPKKSKLLVETPVIGTINSKIVMAGFIDPSGSGALKFTVKK